MRPISRERMNRIYRNIGLSLLKCYYFVKFWDQNYFFLLKIKGTHWQSAGGPARLNGRSRRGDCWKSAANHSKTKSTDMAEVAPGPFPLHLVFLFNNQKVKMGRGRSQPAWRPQATEICTRQLGTHVYGSQKQIRLLKLMGGNLWIGKGTEEKRMTIISFSKISQMEANNLQMDGGVAR